MVLAFFPWNLKKFYPRGIQPQPPAGKSYRRWAAVHQVFIEFNMVVAISGVQVPTDSPCVSLSVTSGIYKAVNLGNLISCSQHGDIYNCAELALTPVEHSNQ